MKARAITLFVLLAAALCAFNIAEQKGRLQQAKEWFLDFLVANARDKIEVRATADAKDVVLIQFDEKDREEYSAWPPAPLDYIIALKRLYAHEPEVLAIVDPLRWENVDTQFIAQLRQSMVPFTSIVLGFDISAEGTGMSIENGDFASNEMPALKCRDDGSKYMLIFNRVTEVPDKGLRIAVQTGFSSLNHPSMATQPHKVPFVAFDGHRLVPSLPAQAVTLFRHVPYASQRIAFGAGARLSLGDEHMVPLDSTGSLLINDNLNIPTVNALALMSPDLGDAESNLTRNTLGKRKIVVLSMSDRGLTQARAIAQALAAPSLQRKPVTWDWLAAAVACLIGFWQLQYRRFGAVAIGLLFAFASLIASLLVFQSSLVWWSPIASILVTCTCTLFCLIWSKKSEPEAFTPGQPAAAESPLP
ncbi:hypothetical protein BH11VER1_BH11VER1_28000 [soil metagenome]